MTTTETREAPPAHFLIKIESFSLLDDCGVEKYETKEFVAGNHKWRLVIYPNGDNNNEKDGDYISVKLAMVDTSSMPKNWEVNAIVNIFLYNQISGNYIYSPGRPRPFQITQSEWGFSKFISKKSMFDPSNGYLMNDSCVFGAEVFVVKREAVTECLSLNSVHPPPSYKHDCKISNFKKLEGRWESEEFSAGGHKWYVCVYPKGNKEATGNAVSIYLNYAGSNVSTHSGRVKTSFTISLINHGYCAHKTRTTPCSFTTSWASLGWDSFIDLATINDPKQGFLVRDCIRVSVEISFLNSALTFNSSWI
ncbi:hypothetical protein ABFS83_07G092300 [Erythranthe nasuta]